MNLSQANLSRPTSGVQVKSNPRFRTFKDKYHRSHSRRTDPRDHPRTFAAGARPSLPPTTARGISSNVTMAGPSRSVL